MTANADPAGKPSREGRRWLAPPDEADLITVWRWLDAEMGDHSTCGAQLEALAKSPAGSRNTCPTCGAPPNGDGPRTRKGRPRTCLSGHEVARWDRIAKARMCPKCDARPSTGRRGECANGHRVADGAWRRPEKAPIEPRSPVGHEPVAWVDTPTRDAETHRARIARTLRRLRVLDSRSRQVLYRVYGPDGFPGLDPRTVAYRKPNDRFPWELCLELAPVAKYTPEVVAVAQNESAERVCRAQVALAKFWREEPERLRRREAGIAAAVEAAEDPLTRTRLTNELATVRRELESVGIRARVRGAAENVTPPPLDLERALGVVLKDPAGRARVVAQCREMMCAAVAAWDAVKRAMP